MEKTLQELILMYRDGLGTLHTDQSTQRNFIYNESSQIIINKEGETITRAGDVVKSVLERDIKLPPLIFWSVQDPEHEIAFGPDEFNLHDGKQRFLSLYNFVRNNGVITKINGVEKSFLQLTQAQQDKLLNYKFDIQVRSGTLKQEEDSFIVFNTTTLPLTYYESLRGALHGKFFYEFEAYINNLKLDRIKAIGRGEQAIWFLYLYLNLIDEDKKSLLALSQKHLELVRDSSFNPKANDFDKKIALYNEFAKLAMTSNNSEKNPQKIARLVNYIIDKNYDVASIQGYYYEGFRKPNDIDKWKFEVHRIAVDKLCKENIRCDFRRFFRDDEKLVLWDKSHKCGKCGQEFKFDELEVDHIISWSEGGKTEITNAQLLCKPCNVGKGGKI